ncbi:LLM class F420-dependent oxidoreductase [Gordonia amarae]|uniref:LLM class F420-dependent oxidoreductase n=1 Tax=Gordonia amarae TaxID=36821 RepID=UPI0021B44EC0|nr:LLM class F420-dependent oxidoreductase [Gordonia amarae]
MTSLKFTLEYPSEIPSAPDDFLLPDVVRAVATAAETAGFSAVALSEHPAPSAKWRDNGGHNTLDPIAALGFMAAATSTIRLLTNLIVLPFHNPYQIAKSLTSLDILSGGRLITGVGAGYLRSEFSAVGVEFEDRARLFDEALDAITSIWTDPATPVSGDGWAATSELWLQRPVQTPHPPIWICGNSRAALRRVVAHGAGWMPLITPKVFASVIRTRAIETPEQFSEILTGLRADLAATGRDPDELDVQIVLPHTDLDDAAAVRAAREYLADLRRRGATWVVIHVDGSSPEAAVDYIFRAPDVLFG